jgi:hypothetical protein
VTRAEAIDLVLAAAWRRAALEALRDLDLPDAWIGAGFVRGPVWDALHGNSQATPLADIDVIYFDPCQHSVSLDMHWERVLGALVPGVPPGTYWSVHNQARMHLRNGDPPYRDTADAMANWLETPTCVAMRLGPAGPELLAPYGLQDLLRMVLRPTPAGLRKPDQYRQRLESKGWFRHWPNLKPASE